MAETEPEPYIPFRIPFPTALISWTAVMTLFALALPSDLPMGEALTLLLLGVLFFLVLVDSWWKKDAINQSDWLAVVICAVVARAFFIFQEPTLSDDLYRYIWEGRVIAAGLNPFAFAPSAPELAFLRDSAIYPSINHPEISAIYPPLNQAIFTALASLGGGVVLFKAAFAALDLLTGWVLYLWLKRECLPRGRVIIWLLHPLVVVEFSGSGHLDVLVCLGLALSLYGFSFRREKAGNLDFLRNSGMFIALTGLTLGALAKLAPLVLVPHFARRIHPRRWLILLAPPLLLGASYLPFSSADGGLFRAMDRYESAWRNNASLYVVVEAAVRWIDPQGARFHAIANGVGGVFGADDLAQRLLRRHPDNLPSAPQLVTARWVLYALFGVWWALLLVKAGEWEWDTLWLAVFMGAFLLSPVNHPWYLTLLVPCLMRRFRPEAFWWTLTIMATYLMIGTYRQTGEWRESELAWWLQYGGMAAIVAIRGLIEWRRKRTAPSP